MKDPICGMDVEPAQAAGSSVYQGQTYYFCSVGCKTAFDADPARYLGHRAEGGHGGYGGHGAGGHGRGHGSHG